MATFKDLLAQTAQTTAGRQETPFAGAFKVLIQQAMNLGQEKRTEGRGIVKEGRDLDTRVALEERTEAADIRQEDRTGKSASASAELKHERALEVEKLKQTGALQRAIIYATSRDDDGNPYASGGSATESAHISVVHPVGRKGKVLITEIEKYLLAGYKLEEEL